MHPQDAPSVAFAAAHPAHYSFKPIDCLLSSSSSSEESYLDANRHPNNNNIFRDLEGRESVPTVQRANPIRNLEEEEDMEEDGDESDNRVVISPYPFSHTSQEEIEDRERLPWPAALMERVQDIIVDEEEEEEDADDQDQDCIVHVDYARYFELGSVGAGDDVMDDECDDFSISSHEVESLTGDDLGAISEDPSSFWEEGIEHVATDRSWSPTQVSLESNPANHSQEEHASPSTVF